MVIAYFYSTVSKDRRSHTCLQQQSKKQKKSSVDPSKNTDEKERKENNTDNCKAFCVTRKHKKNNTFFIGKSWWPLFDQEMFVSGR